MDKAVKKVIGKPFQRGDDPRRHQLTAEERRRGGRTRAAQEFREFARYVAEAYDRSPPASLFEDQE